MSAKGFPSFSNKHQNNFVHIPFYTNIKLYIDQCQFGSFDINLSRANKCGV